MAELFENAQWKVTEFGLELIAVHNEYLIDAARLARLTQRLSHKYYDWPLHMAEKSWVDIEAFLEAFAEALKFHSSQIGAAIDQKVLSDSFGQARKVASNRSKPKAPPDPTEF